MTTGRGWYLWSFVKASMWTAALLGVAQAMGVAPGLRQWPISGIALTGGLLFGLGAGSNGACSFSTLARLAEGHMVMIFTLAGWPLGMMAIHTAMPNLHHDPTSAAALPVWVLWLLGPWLVWELLGILQRLVREGPTLLSGAHWPLSFSVAVIAVMNVALLTLTGTWSYTSTLICATHAAPLSSCANPLRLGIISLAALVGMFGSAVLRRSFRLRRVRAAAALRHALSGLAMGAGAALIPGGNDGLILFGIPSLSPHAIPAWLGICVGIAVALSVMRALGRPLMAIRCENDICRAGL